MRTWVFGLRMRIRETARCINACEDPRTHTPLWNMSTRGHMDQEDI